MPIKYFSVCSGIGGFELGIQRALPDAECVGYSEISPNAIKVYEKHFPTHKNYGDITTITDTPDFDLLVGGFPCQSFSVAGIGNGFNDTRGTIFFDIARILKDKRPRHFLLENVRGLLGNKGGESFQTILKILTDIGYRVEVQLLNSKDFGLPQHRERVFFIGHLGGECSGEVLHFGGFSPEVHTVQGCVLNTIRAKYSTTDAGSFIVENKLPEKETRLKQIGSICATDHNSIWGRVYSTEGLAPTISSGGGGLGAKTGLYIDLKTHRIRLLSPLECERAQGFPDNWTEGVAVTRRYACIGNAVSVNVIEAIMNKLKNCL